MFGECGTCTACFDTQGDGPPSPCVKVCALDPETGWCVGCARAGDEIAAWTAMSAQQKRDLLIQLPARLAALEARGARRFAP